MARASSGIYYGWYIVAIACFATMLVVGGTTYTFGIMVRPVSEEFGLSRASVNTGMIIFHVGLAIAGPFMGKLIDRVSIRAVMAVSAIVMGVSLVAIGLSHSLWLSSIIIAIPLVLSFNGAGTLMSYALLARWFTFSRGRAMALAAIGQSFGGIIVLPLMAMLVEAAGWRQALIIEGIVVGMLLLLLSLAVKERPRSGDIEPGSTNRPVAVQKAAEDRVWTVPMLLRSGQFWAISIAIGLILGIVQTLLATLVPYGVERGFTVLQASYLISIISVASIFGKVGLAVIADRIDRGWLLAFGTLFIVILNAALLARPDYPALMVCCFASGLALGGIYPVFAALLADRFGISSYATVHGMVSPVIAGLSALCVRYIGEVFDRTGSYWLAFVTFIGLLLFAAVLIAATTWRRLRNGRLMVVAA